MLSLELIRGTRVYQELKEEAREEVKEEVKIEMIAKLLQRGMSVQEVAEILELDVEVVRNIEQGNKARRREAAERRVTQHLR